MQHTGQAHGTPPLQIPYDLLRYCLNDRPPFTDCETLLVMWIAKPYRDSNNNIVTPDTISDDDPQKLKKLHDLDWQQYAIPITMRCCFKDNTEKDTCTSNQNNGPHKHVHDRFLISYPFYQSTEYRYNRDANLQMKNYQFHFRFNAAYNKNKTNLESLFVKDLIDYSQDYIVTFHNIAYKDNSLSTTNNSSFFDIQKFLFKKLGSCKSLYVRKGYTTINDNNAALSNRRYAAQVYYIYVPSTLYDININYTDYILAKGTNTKFIPSQAKLDPNNQNSEYYFSKNQFDKWKPAFSNFFNLDQDKCATDDNIFVTIFNNTSQLINEIPGSISLDDAYNLKTWLEERTSLIWDNLYISTFGVSPYNIYESQCYLFNPNADPVCRIFPLGLLNNYIKITRIDNNTTITETYGTSYNKVIVGFKQMYDYDYSDMYHFKYDSINRVYKPVQSIYNFNASTAGHAVFNESSVPAPTVTAYVMDYNP